MNEYVTDTHSLLWYLINSSLLGKNASAAFDEAKNGLALIYIPTIVFAELYYLNVKNKQIIDFPKDFQKIKQSGQFVSIPFEADDVLDFDNDSAVKEMHDRIIVGVARRLSVPLLTKDQNITASGLVKIVW
jgi:PIN domain nuclease of toxin-antitoxin system